MERVNAQSKGSAGPRRIISETKRFVNHPNRLRNTIVKVNGWNWQSSVEPQRGDQIESKLQIGLAAALRGVHLVLGVRDDVAETSQEITHGRPGPPCDACTRQPEVTVIGRVLICSPA